MANMDVKVSSYTSVYIYTYVMCVCQLAEVACDSSGAAAISEKPQLSMLRVYAGRPAVRHRAWVDWNGFHCFLQTGWLFVPSLKLIVRT